LAETELGRVPLASEHGAERRAGAAIRRGSFRAKDLGPDRLATGFDWIEAYTDRLKAVLSNVPGLVLQTPLPYAQSSGIVTFHLPGLDAVKIYEHLLLHDRICLSPTSAVEFGQPGIPVSAHVFNTDDDLNRLLSGLRRVVATGID
jgi:selenocysteine lyase/cysteine desulfurase